MSPVIDSVSSPSAFHSTVQPEERSSFQLRMMSCWNMLDLTSVMLPLRSVTDNFTEPSAASSLIEGISTIVFLPLAARKLDWLSLWMEVTFFPPGKKQCAGIYCGR